jgi:hypothetical protein
MLSEIPKDLGLKIGTPNEVLWDNVKKAAEEQLKNAKESILIQEAVIEMAEEKIKKEQSLNT